MNLCVQDNVSNLTTCISRYLFCRSDRKTHFSPSRYGAIREIDAHRATRRARYHVMIRRAFSYKSHSNNIRRHAHTSAK